MLRYPTFVRFWLADAVSSLGTFVSGLALQLLLIQTLHANQTEVGLVRAAGVTTVRELAHRNPARLAQNMKDVNTKRKLVRVLPSERSVEQLIERARKLAPKISY